MEYIFSRLCQKKGREERQQTPTRRRKRGGRAAQKGRGKR